MVYLTLSLECECGRTAASVQEVGFTSDHQLILRWHCGNCNKRAYVLKPLDECWKECPSGVKPSEPAPADPAAIEESDAKFLQALGVKLPD